VSRFVVCCPDVSARSNFEVVYDDVAVSASASDDSSCLFSHQTRPVLQFNFILIELTVLTVSYLLGGNVRFFVFTLGCILIKRHNLLFLEAATPTATTAAAVESCDNSKENKGHSSDTEPPDRRTLVEEELLPHGVGSTNDLV